MIERSDEFTNRMDARHLGGPPFRLTAAPSAYLIFGAIWGGLGLLALAAAFRDASAFRGVAICVAAFAGIAVSLASRSVEVRGDTIIYRTFMRSRSITLSEIQRAEVKTGIGNSWADLFSGPIRLEILPHADAGKNLLRINLKPFRREEVQKLLRFVGAVGA